MSVIITGMHRSGTSATARLVDAFGLVPGEGPVMGPAPDNPRGFFERRDVSEFNDRWLARMGGAWWAPPSATPATWRRVPETDVRQARAELDVFAGDGPAWYSKDPRTALLLPLWDRLALREHPVIVCVRHPDEVAVSLELRNGFSPRRALALWAAYTAASVNHVGGRPSLIVDYGSLLAAPLETVVALEEFLRATGHVPRPEWSADAMVGLVERDLHRAAPRRWNEELAPHRKRLVELYRELAKRHGLSLAEVAPIVPSDWVEETLDELRQLLGEERLRVAAEDARDRAERETVALQAERERMLADGGYGELVARLAERDRALVQAGEELDGMRTQLAATAGDVVVARETIARLERTLTEEVARAAAAAAALEAERDTLGQRLALLGSSVHEAETDADAEAERAQLLHACLAEQQARAESLGAELAALRTRVGEQAARVAEQAAAISERDAALARETALVAAAREGAQAAQSEAAALRETVQELRHQVAVADASAAAVRAELEAERIRADAAAEREAALRAEQQAAVTALEARIGELDVRLEDAAVQGARRRAAMAEMSVELERRRARAHRAEHQVADLQHQLVQLRADLEATVRARDAATADVESLLLQCQDLRRGHDRVCQLHGAAQWELDRMARSRSWRWGRMLTSPGRLARRLLPSGGGGGS